jgi:hypothetical protein
MYLETVVHSLNVQSHSPTVYMDWLEEKMKAPETQ